MNPDVLFLFVTGYEQTGDGHYALYFDGPVPRPAPARLYGIRTAFFCTFAGVDSEGLKAWLTANLARQRMRVPAYTRGVRAVLVASGYNCGVGSALRDLFGTPGCRVRPAVHGHGGGQAHDELAPRPSPPLRASIVPPCILTSDSPMPSPPVVFSSIRSTWVNISNTLPSMAGGCRCRRP